MVKGCLSVFLSFKAKFLQQTFYEYYNAQMYKKKKPRKNDSHPKAMLPLNRYSLYVCVKIIFVHFHRFIFNFSHLYNKTFSLSLSLSLCEHTYILLANLIRIYLCVTVSAYSGLCVIKYTYLQNKGYNSTIVLASHSL